MDFIDFRREEQFNDIDRLSHSTEGVVIFKHSTRCAISSMAFNRFKRNWNEDPGKVPVFYLDLLQNRSISDEVAERYNVRHQSPQVLLIKEGKCIYQASHNEIIPGAILEQVNG